MRFQINQIGWIGYVLVICLAVLCLAPAGCGERDSLPEGKHAEQGTSPYKVVTTVAMITDIVEQVAGDKAHVMGLIKEGVDPHLYRPTRNDVAALSNADVIFYVGLMLEGKMADILVRVASRGKIVCPVTERIDESYLLVPEDAGGHFDPHVWMDVSAWSKAVDVVVNTLAEYDSPNAAFYRNNGDAYKKKLSRLDEYARVRLASIPPQQRILITAHDAFNYFGRAYGLQVMGIQGLSTESEAGLDDLNRLVVMIVANGVSAIFVESSVSDKNVKALVEGAKARGHELKIGGELFSDAMGEAGDYEGTYIGMIDHNATIITRALGGEAPAGGMDGLLGGHDDGE